MSKKGVGLIQILIVLVVIVVVAGGLLLIFNKDDVEEEIVVKEPIVTEKQLPPADPTPSQKKQIDEATNVETADECLGVALQDLCYLNLAFETKDNSLCSKIIDEDYKRNCMEKI